MWMLYLAIIYSRRYLATVAEILSSTALRSDLIFIQWLIGGILQSTYETDHYLQTYRQPGYPQPCLSLFPCLSVGGLVYAEGRHDHRNTQ